MKRKAGSEMGTSNARVQAAISYFNGIIECSTDRNEIAAAQMAKEALIHRVAYLTARTAVGELPWYTLKDGKMSSGAKGRETAWYKASDVLNTLDSIIDSQNCTCCKYEFSSRECEPCRSCPRNAELFYDQYTMVRNE